MRRNIVLILTALALAVSMAAFMGCGGSSDSGGGSAKVALFANSTYNDYDSTTGSEVGYMAVELPFMSILPTKFSGVTAADIEAATSGFRYMMIPSQISDLSGDLDAAAKDAKLVNSVFGYSITNGIGCSLGSAMFAALGNTETIFSSGSGTIPTVIPCGIYWDLDSLPVDGHSIYDASGTDVAMAQINSGSGRIIYIAPSYSTYYDYNHNLFVKVVGLSTNGQVGTPFEAVPVDTLSGVDIEVYGPDGVTLLATTTYGMWLPLKKGNYAYVKITGNGGTPTGAYTAQTGGGCVWGGVCFGSDQTAASDPDKYEDNDTMDKATVLREDNYKELFMSTGDVDWIKVYY